MEATEQQSNPVTYPERVYDGKDFVPNLNREQSSDNLTTVLTDKNEVLGFPDHTSQQEMQAAIDADRNGSISTYKPSFYDKFIRQPLQDMGMSSFQPTFATDIKPSPERAFATSMARAATADIFKPPQSDKEAQAYPAQAFAGSLVGSIAAFASGSALLDGWKLEQLTPFAENIIKGGILGGAYKGVSETSNELRDSDHPDLAKIGMGVLHDSLWWGGISGLSGVASKPVGVAASAGLGYLMAKSDGADEPSALLNGSVLAGFHLLQSHGDQEDVRKLVTDKLQSNVADYILAKNPMVHPIVADQGGREFVSNHVEDVIDKSNEDVIKRNTTPEGFWINDKFVSLEEANKEVEKPEDDKIDWNKKFDDPYDPELLDKLSVFFNPHEIVRWPGRLRLSIGNLPHIELKERSDMFKEMDFEEANQEQRARNKLVDDIVKARELRLTPIEEASQSKEILNQVMNNMTRQVTLNEGGENANQGAEISQIASGEEIANNQNNRSSYSHSHEDQATTNEFQEGSEQQKQEGIEQKLLQDNQKQKESLEESSQKELNPKNQESSKLESPLQNDVSSSKGILTSEDESSKEKTSGLSKSLEEDAIHKGLIEDLGDLPSYKTRDMEEIAKKVSDFIKKDPELAKRIALGDAPEQDGLRSQELFTGLKSKAFKEGDISLIHELGTSEKASAMATELGQRVKALDSGDSENPINIVREITKSKEKPTKEIMKDQEKTAKILKKELEASKKKVPTWDEFIESIKC